MFESIVKESHVAATTVAVFLTETLTALRRESIAIEKVADNQIMEIFKGVGSGEIVKEAVTDVFVWLSKNKYKSIRDAVDGLGLKMLSKAELTMLVDKVIAENRQLVDQLGEKAFGKLIGILMKEARGKARPGDVGALVKERLK